MSKYLFRRQLAITASLVSYVLVISLVLAALLTEFWVETGPLQRKNKTSELSFVKSGLFSGVRQIDWGLGPQKQYFSVLDEIHNGVSFINKTTWIFIIFFIALGLLWTFIGLIIALLNVLIEEVSTIVGPEGFYLWSSLAFFSYMTSVLLFSRQFTSDIIQNVLLPNHLNSGFSSTGLTRFGISFWLFGAGILLLFVPCILIFSSPRQETKREKLAGFDHTALMF